MLLLKYVLCGAIFLLIYGGAAWLIARFCAVNGWDEASDRIEPPKIAPMHHALHGAGSSSRRSA